MKKNNIHLDFLLYSGEQEGLIKCSQPMDSVAAYKIPRQIAHKCSKIDDLKKSGIYLLIGEDDDRNTTVYVGQGAQRVNGNGVYGRIMEPHNTKADNSTDDWTVAIAFVSRLTDFDMTALSCLEHNLHNQIADAKKARLLNKQTPTKSSFSEELECDIQRFCEQINVLLHALGLDITTAQEKDKLLRMKYKDAEAKGYFEGLLFVVCQGSKISSGLTQTCPSFVERERGRLSNKLKDRVLLEDIRMSSPSAAASFIGGASLNGWEVWKTPSGKSLNEDK